MADPDQLSKALVQFLPAQYHPQVPQIARFLAQLIERGVDTYDTQSPDSTAPEIRPALQILAGRRIVIDQGLISFGSHNQFGDISIGDIVAGDKLDLHIVLPQPEQTYSPVRVSPPAVEALIGRDGELAVFARPLIEHHLAVVVGMTGVGKTTFAARLAGQMAAEDDICWYQLRPGVSFPALLSGLAEFVAWRGDPGLRGQLRAAFAQEGRSYDPGVLVGYVERALRGKGFLICLDDYHEGLGDSNIELVGERLKVLADEGAIRLIVTSQRCPPFIGESEFPRLKGLNEGAVGELLAVRGLDPGLAPALWEATEGNAVYVTSALKLLAGADAPAALIAGLDPADHFAMLFRQVYDGLPEDQQRVMQAVAVFQGYPGSRDAVEAVLDADDQQNLLDDLAASQLLVVTKLDDERLYDQHQLWRRYCYGRLGQRRRSQLHLRAAAYYEGKRLNPRQAARLFRLRAARHYAWADEYGRAAELATAQVWSTLMRGGAADLRALLDGLVANKDELEAEALGAVRIARGRCHWALGESKPAVAELELAFADLERRQGLPGARRLQAEACALLGRFLQYSLPEQALEWVETGQRLTAGREWPDIEADLSIKRGGVLVGRSQYTEARAAVEQGLGLLPDTPSLLRIDGLTVISAILNNQGHFAEGAGKARECLVLCDQLRDDQGVDDHTRRISLLNNLAVATYMDGEWASAKAAFAEAVELARAWGPKAQQIRLGQNLGLIAIDEGDDELAQARLEEVCALAQAEELHRLVVGCLSGLADLRLRRDDLAANYAVIAEAEELIAQAEDLITKHSAERARLPELARYRAEALLARGQPEAALAQAERSLALAREQTNRSAEGQALRTLALAQTALDRHQAAAESFAASVALLEEDDYQLARTHASWGKALRARGLPAEGDELLAQARATFSRLGARRDLAQIGAEPG